jgi:WhiB family redox-sensing transcriptional regulator
MAQAHLQSDGVTQERPAARPNRQNRTGSSVPAERYDAEAWRPLAACRHVDSDLFFPAGSSGDAAKDVERAKAVCAGCPVQRPCLAFAIATNQEFGVWGGCDERERPALRRKWRAATAAGACP